MNEFNEFNENFNDKQQPDNSPENYGEIQNQPKENIEDIILNSINKLSENPQKNSQSGKILLIVFTVLIFIVITSFAVYSIAYDISNIDSNIITGSAGDGRTKITLNTARRPTDKPEFTDETGKYTIEGLAQIIRPQVVEIYTYADKSVDLITGSGSGIIISEDGYIVTNTHVLDDMEKYVVNTYDGQSYDAEIVGRDAKTDISVIKISANDLTAAQFGDSDDVIQGESVVAIGNPAGLTGSITDGIVSGINRKIRTEATGFEMNCIQTNAAISPGNSGGALVNMYGQVIGITSSKYAATTTEGLGFAITINEAKPIIEELIAQGYVSGRVRIGITFYSTYASYAAIQFKDEFGFDIPKELENALWIEEVSKDCDISNTKLKSKDFIISINDVSISDYNELFDVIKDKKGGDKIKAKCARVSKDKKIEYFEIEFKLMEDTSGDF